MTDLLNIAKECGADIHYLNLGQQFHPISVGMTPAKLHATVEKVCGPLVEALEKCRAHHSEFIRRGIVNEALSSHEKLMGQDK